VFGELIKLPAALVTSDASIVPELAVDLLSEVRVGVGEEEGLVERFRERMRDVVLGKAGCDVPTLHRLLCDLLPSLVPPWSGLPEGWT
jgi:hypothetical protein